MIYVGDYLKHFRLRKKKMGSSPCIDLYDQKYYHKNVGNGPKIFFILSVFQSPGNVIVLYNQQTQRHLPVW